jgi:dTDP-4-amino-4,6-dideoxygalactose transaminase
VIPLTVPPINDDDHAAVAAVLASGFLVQGPRVAAFEEAMSRHTGMAHAVAVSNCTAALHLSLLGCKISADAPVLVPAFSWMATANVVELVGCRPVFVDIDPATFNMCPAAFAAALATTPDAAAAIVVHAFGNVAAMPELLTAADAHGVRVIEDAACALGAAGADGRAAGSYGRSGCFSFHPRKAITTGEGGVVVTDDRELADYCRAARNHGLDPNAAAPDFVLPGFNYRMTDLQAALGCSQMARLDAVVGGRRAAAARYDELLAGTPVASPAVAAGATAVYQSYVVLLPAAAAPRRAAIIAALRDAGIQTTIGTCHMPLGRYFRERYGYVPGDFPVTDDVAARALTLPLYDTIDAADQARVVECLLALVE